MSGGWGNLGGKNDDNGGFDRITTIRMHFTIRL